jgi:hypothetical protein
MLDSECASVSSIIEFEECSCQSMDDRRDPNLPILYPIFMLINLDERNLRLRYTPFAIRRYVIPEVISQNGTQGSQP